MLESVDQEVMESFGLYFKDLLVRVHDRGVGLTWTNEQILHWYETEGRKLQTKSQFRKLPAVIIYLLRRNDRRTLMEKERVVESIRELEKARSDELRKLRAEVEAFAYEKHNWAVQSSAWRARIVELEKELGRSQEYAVALEACCGKVGLPVSAIRQAGSAVTMGDSQEESEDEEILALGETPREGVFQEIGARATLERTPATRERALEPGPGVVTPSYYRPSEPGKPWQRSPIATRRKTGTGMRKPAKVAVLKTVTNADDTVTVISRPLTCEECSRHKEVVGMMPRRGPFQPYWDNLMLQASVYNLELRDVWQVTLLTIPEELRSKLPDDLRSGAIVIKQEDESVSEVLDRLKEALLQLRGPTHVAWHKILDIRQASKEAFEVFAERMWASFKEHSGIEEANRDQEVLLQLLKNNAGPHIQQALANGAEPPENTYRALVEWASKIENRLSKQGKLRPIAATQWVAEGVGVAAPKKSEERMCCFCGRAGHRVDQCWRLLDKLGLPRQPSKQEANLLQEIAKLNILKPPVASEPGPAGPKSNGKNPYSSLQASLAALAAKYEDTQ